MRIRLLESLRWPRLSPLVALILVFAVPDPVAAAGTAQGAGTIPTLRWKLDEQGLQQPDPQLSKCSHCGGKKQQACVRCQTAKLPKCAECGGKNASPCHHCAGSGLELNPLQEQICPICSGNRVVGCSVCSGLGKYEIVAGGTFAIKCAACNAGGALRCLACKGRGKVGVVLAGGSKLLEAPVGKLRSAQRGIEQALENLRGFTADKKQIESMKELRKAIRAAAKVVPVLEGGRKMLESRLKSMRKAPAYDEQAQWAVAQFHDTRDRLRVFLEQQKALLAACIARAEHNARALQAAKRDRQRGR